jgi:hypothetical protein
MSLAQKLNINISLPLLNELATTMKMSLSPSAFKYSTTLSRADLPIHHDSLQETLT